MQYTQMAQYYDKIYSFKDYKAEIDDLLIIINQYIRNDLITLLDIACGTGKHLELLKTRYLCEGLDISSELIEIAKKRNPDLTFHHSDMLNISLDKRFDIITCFFGSIGHVLTSENLYKAINKMKQHLTSKGILIIEPWHTPEQFRMGRTNLITYEEDDLKIARACSSQIMGNISILDLHHLICTPKGTEHFIEHLELGLFTETEYLDSLGEGGFTVVHEKIRSNGNGVYLAFRR